MNYTNTTSFHMMAKPIGAVCNLKCQYCYYLHKTDLLQSSSSPKISDEILEKYIREYIQYQPGPVINFSWQGGEPTLAGIDFFKKVIKYQNKYSTPDKQIQNDIQTNGTLIDENWCIFLKENNFLVGISIDGPKDLHDIYRTDCQNNSSFEKTVNATKLMKKYNVDFNVLTVLNNKNTKEPLKVYRFLRDEIGSQFIQFIPCIETKDFTSIAPKLWDKSRLPTLGDPKTNPDNPDSILTDFTLNAEDYGNFMIAVFDEWLHNDIGKTFVRTFDVSLGLWLGMPSSSCHLAQICGKALAFEHDGNVYSCDHFVYPEYHLGNIKDKSLIEMVLSEEQMNFGFSKEDALPKYCLECEYRFACNGGCPKNRMLVTPDGEFGLNYLCSGLKKFFKHIDPWMQKMGEELKAGRTADNVIKNNNNTD